MYLSYPRTLGCRNSEGATSYHAYLKKQIIIAVVKSMVKLYFVTFCWITPSWVGGTLLVGSLYNMIWGKIKECTTGGSVNDVEKDQHKQSAESSVPGRVSAGKCRGQRFDIGIGYQN